MAALSARQAHHPAGGRTRPPVGMAAPARQPAPESLAGASLAVVVMAFAMEGAKLVTTGWLARRWRVTAPV